MLSHDDLPHPVPTRAWLRWEENYFWIFMDPDSDIYCAAEPTCDRAFASFTILHQGKRTISGMKMPSPFKHAKLPNYGGLAVHFVKPQAESVLEYEDENVAAKPILTRLPLHSRKPGSKVYRAVENMCRVRCEQTGGEGLANVEVGALVDA